MWNSEPRDWILVGVGGLFILGGLLAVLTGRVSQFGGRKWGVSLNYDIEREYSPIQFWFVVLLQLLIGAAVLGYGVLKLAG